MEIFPVDESFNQTILGGIGEYYFVVRISNGLAAKFSIDRDTERLMRECDIASALYSDRVRIPRPEGIYEVALRVPQFSWYRRVAAFLMEYIDGKDPDELSPQDKEIARKSANTEIQKARILGYLPIDADNNYLWCPAKGGSVLFDFHCWYPPKKFHVSPS